MFILAKYAMLHPQHIAQRSTIDTATVETTLTARTLSWLNLDRIVQQKPIAAAHHPDAMSHEATRPVLPRVALEVFLRAAKSEQPFGDGSIALALQARIKRTQ